jgi:endo-1,4-beta-D-glucanase Y
MFYSHKFFLLLALMFNSVFNVILGQNKPFPQALDFPNTIKPNNVSQPSMNNSVTSFYEYWKSTYLKPSNGKTPGGYFVYVSVESGTKTVSEAHGYGMIISALLAGYDPAAKTYFDGMYYFYKDHPSTIDADLMSWIISSDEDAAKDEDSATDGDMDIAYALLLAHDQWGSAGAINYLAEAKRIINHGIEESTTNNFISAK